MINFIVPWDQKWIFENLVNRVSAENSSILKIITYHDLSRQDKLLAGIYILTGYGVLTKIQKEAAVQVSNLLESGGSEFMIMNHPGRVLERYMLLKTLHQRGINQFRAFRINEIQDNSIKLHFPVFIREEGKHSGSLTGILNNSDELTQAINQLKNDRYRMNELLVVEFVDTSGENGLFRKYSAFRVGDAIIPRYLSLSYHWVVKEHATDPSGSTLYTDELIEEEFSYIQNNPHQKELRDIFDIANIEYGRIDYGFNDGKLQVWEINTLPVIGRYPGLQNEGEQISKKIAERKEKRTPVKELFHTLMDEAISDMIPEKSDSSIALTFTKELRRGILIEKSKHRLTNTILESGSRLPKLNFIQPLRSTIKKCLRKLIYS